jgi:hypothetical protein
MFKVLLTTTLIFQKPRFFQKSHQIVTTLEELPEYMKTETKSRILLTTLILAGMSPSCYLLSYNAYVPYGVMLLVLGVAILVWIWKPWQWF